MRRKPDLEALAKRLYERRDEAVTVPFAQRSHGDWHPEEGQCHGNVSRCVNEHPEYKAVRGWLMFGPLMQIVRFNAHSVIEQPDGTHIDIAPAEGASKRYPFIRHDGDESEFVNLIETHKIVHVNHVIRQKREQTDG